MPSPSLAVDGEGGAPYVLGGGKLGAVPVGDVANALGGQRVAGVPRVCLVAPRGPQVITRLRIIWLTRPSETPSQRARCSRGIIGWSVMRSSVRFSAGLMPKAGAACAIRSGRGMDARFRSGD